MQALKTISTLQNLSEDQKDTLFTLIKQERHEAIAHAPFFNFRAPVPRPSRRQQAKIAVGLGLVSSYLATWGVWYAMYPVAAWDFVKGGAFLLGIVAALVLAAMVLIQTIGVVSWVVYNRIPNNEDDFFVVAGYLDQWFPPESTL